MIKCKTFLINEESLNTIQKLCLNRISEIELAILVPSNIKKKKIINVGDKETF